MMLKSLVVVFASVVPFAATMARAEGPDPKFYIFLCFGQSNSEGFPGIEEQDKRGVDPRFRMLAAVDSPKMNRKAGNWYAAVPPLCRPGTGLSPGDFFAAR